MAHEFTQTSIMESNVKQQSFSHYVYFARTIPHHQDDINTTWFKHEMIVFN